MTTTDERAIFNKRVSYFILFFFVKFLKTIVFIIFYAFYTEVLIVGNDDFKKFRCSPKNLYRNEEALN
jgi:hypothetical protein